MVIKSILIISATSFELEPLRTFYNKQLQLESNVFGNIVIDFLISGIGMMQTAICIHQHISNQQYDMVFQIGIAGAYNTSLKLGSVIQIHSEQYGDLGAENHDEYLDAAALNWHQQQTILFENNNLIKELESGSSISVNMCAGNQKTISFRKARYNVDIENMEGIAFFQVMKNTQVPYYQIRSISNYVIPRDKSLWNIPLAIENLNNFVIQYLQKLIK